jgi:5-methylcytosine-specific restriction endonuclease McrA
MTTDHILPKSRGGTDARSNLRAFLELFGNDVVAQLDALVADVHAAGTRDELSHIVLILAAEGASARGGAA